MNNENYKKWNFEIYSYHDKDFIFYLDLNTGKKWFTDNNGINKIIARDIPAYIEKKLRTYANTSKQ